MGMQVFITTLIQYQIQIQQKMGIKSVIASSPKSRNVANHSRRKDYGKQMHKTPNEKHVK